MHRSRDYAPGPVVLFVSYSSVLGGAERLLVDYAAALPVPSCLACPPGPLADAARAAGVPVLLRPRRALELRGGVASVLRATAHLVAHAHEIRTLARNLGPEPLVAWGMRPAIAAMVARRRFVFAHNDLLPGPLIGVAVRAAARRADRVIALSDAIAAELGTHAVVLHPGVDLEAFAAVAEAPPAQPPEVLVLGALVEWKRPDLALEAVARARRSVPGLRLRLVGAPLGSESALVDRLRARAQQPDLAGAVELAGHERDPRGSLARASCLLHCAPREPFGLAVVEALAAGRPAVVPAACGPAEIVDESCGELYVPGDAAAAADALVATVSDPARAARLGEAGRARARERFDVRAARARFAALIGDAAGDRPRRGSWAAAESITVVTVTRNSAADLPLLLDSVARHLPGAEVVVVDCASGDGTVELAKGRGGVTVVELSENVGFGRACNIGVKRVRTPVAALLNPDVELLDGSLRGLAGQLLRDAGPARIVAPRVLNGDGTLQDTVHPLPGSPPDLIRSLVPPAAVPGRAGVALAPWRSAAPRRVGWAVGCALVARTGTLRQLGPFDESLFMYGEDLELGMRAQRAGVETWLWPAAVVVHRRAHSTEREFGGEPFERLARARHEAVRRGRGDAWARLDDGTQLVTFAARLAYKRALGRAASRERRQLAAAVAIAQRRR